MTFTLPSGHKVRTVTKRRYALVSDHAEDGAAVLQRSDTFQTLVAARRRHGYSVGRAFYIGDTVTGELRPFAS